jgi:hypothetical protein
MTPDMAVPLMRRSAMESASECLFRYKAIWIDGVEDQSDYALRGIAFHAAANRYIHALVENQTPQDHDIAKIAFLEGIATVPIPGRLVLEVRELFDRWAEHFAVDLPHFMLAEERQERSDQVFTPDLVYGRPNELEIRDFKTFYVELTETQARSDWQARWYIRNAMRQWPGFASYRFTFEFVRLGKTLSLTFSPDELDALDRDVEAVLGMVAKAAKSGVWPATPGPACTYCELKCPIVDNLAVIPKRFLTPDLAREGAALAIAAEQAVKLAKKTLKQYCVANGPLVVNGVEWANRPVEERRYPVSAVMEALQARNAAGIFDQPTKGLTISHSALSKLFKQFPELEDALKVFVQAKTSYRFSAKKPGIGDDGDDE